MRYCEKCNYITDESMKNCPRCKSVLKKDEPPKNFPVAVITAAGFERERIAAALNDNGVPCTQRAAKKQPSAEIITGVNSATADILVAAGDYDKARDILVGIGAVKLEDEEIIEDSADNRNETKDNKNTRKIRKVKTEGHEEFEEMSPKKRLFVRIVSVILFIIVVWGVVAGTDFIMSLIKDNLF